MKFWFLNIFPICRIKLVIEKYLPWKNQSNFIFGRHIGFFCWKVKFWFLNIFPICRKKISYRKIPSLKKSKHLYFWPPYWILLKSEILICEYFSHYVEKKKLSKNTFLEKISNFFLAAVLDFFFFFLSEILIFEYLFHMQNKISYRKIPFWNKLEQLYFRPPYWIFFFLFFF